MLQQESDPKYYFDVDDSIGHHFSYNHYAQKCMWFFVLPGSEFFSAVSKERQKWCFRKALSSPPPASNPGQQGAREEGQESLECWGDCRATEAVLPQALYCQTQVPCRRRGKVSQQIAWRQIFVFLSMRKPAKSNCHGVLQSNFEDFWTVLCCHAYIYISSEVCFVR